jgi:hypothetical protein
MSTEPPEIQTREAPPNNLLKVMVWVLLFSFISGVIFAVFTPYVVTHFLVKSCEEDGGQYNHQTKRCDI